MSSAQVTLKTTPQAASSKESLKAIPAGSTVAVFESRAGAVAAEVQLLVDDESTALWCGTGRQAATAIRQARADRSLIYRLLRGFGDEELLVREVLSRAESGRSVLIVKGGQHECLRALGSASHVYQFGLWTVRAIR